MTPRKVNRADLKDNHKLYTEEQIVELKDIVERDKSEDKTAVFVPRIKNDPDRPYSVMSMDGQLYAIYRGQSSKKHLGSGAFGKVKLAQNLETGEWVAMKILNRRSAEDDIEADIHNALGTGFTAIHERQKSSGTTLTTKYVFAMALAPGVSMETVFFDAKYNPLNMDTINRLNACKAVVKEYIELHQKGVLHIDIKLENLIYDEKTNKVSIIDYGMSAFMDENRQIVATHRGSPISIPPEVSKLKSKNIYNEKTEVFGIGRALADICGFKLSEIDGKKSSKNGNSQYEAIKTSESDLPGVQELAEICNQMLKSDPAQRLDLSAVYNQLIDLEALVLPDHILAILVALETNDKVAIERELNNAMQVQGFDINHIIDNYGGLIHYAAICGSDNGLEMLLKNGADVNLKNKGQETALHLASRHQRDTTPDVAVVLLDNENIDLDVKNNKGQTALDVANEAGNEDMKADILTEIEDRKSVLRIVKDKIGSFVSTVQSMLSSPSVEKKVVAPTVPVQRDVGSPVSSSSTSLMTLALRNSESDVYQSVSKLHQAIRDNNMSAIVEMLNAGVDLNHKINGDSALHVAAKSDNYNLKIVGLLIDKGGNVNAIDEKGQTLLHLAVDCNDTELASILLDNPLVDVNVQDKVGDTAMHLAYLYQYSSIAELVIEKRSDVDMTLANTDGLSVEDIRELAQGMPADIPEYTPAEPHPLDINLDRISSGLPGVEFEGNDSAMQNDRKRIIN